MRITFILCTLCASICTIQAQVRTVFTDIYGNYTVEVAINETDWAIVSQQGDIIELNSDLPLEFYSDFFDYEAGKIKKIGNIQFSYYSNMFAYETGKLKSIGNIRFNYYSDFNDYEMGKVKSIDNVAFSYYSNFNEYEKGKLKSIDSNRYTYYPGNHQPNRYSNLQSGKRNFECKGINFQVCEKFPKRGRRNNH